MLLHNLFTTLGIVGTTFTLLGILAAIAGPIAAMVIVPADTWQRLATRAR